MKFNSLLIGLTTITLIGLARGAPIVAPAVSLADSAPPSAASANIQPIMSLTPEQRDLLNGPGEKHIIPQPGNAQ